METYFPVSAFPSQFFDDNGDPLSGGTVNAFIAGTSTPAAMYIDSDGTSAGEIITLDARGEPEVSENTISIYVDTAVIYDFTLKDSTGSVIYTVDRYSAGAALNSLPSTPTITSAKALTSLIDGQAIYVKQFKAGVDGGGGTYRYDAGSSATADELTILALDTLSGRLFNTEVQKGIVFTVPADYATLQLAVDEAALIYSALGASVDIQIEAGHNPLSGIAVSNGDYSFISISSVSGTITLSASFSQSGVFIAGDNAKMPVLNCLIDANSRGTGYQAHNASSGYVNENCGVINTWGDGLAARYGSYCFANDTVWTGAAQNGVTGSGIIVWSALASCEGADVSNSGYYGAQAAHGGILDFRLGVADSCTRYGIRATDSGHVDADGASANTCLEGVRVFNNSTVNFENGSATSATQAGVSVSKASTLNGRNAVLTGAGTNGALIAGGATADLVAADVSNATEEGLIVSGGSICSFQTGTASNCESGIKADRASSISAVSAVANNNTINNIVASNGSNIAANSATATGAGQYGIFAERGSTIDCESAVATGATTRGIYAYASSTINAKSANGQKGGSPSASDIVIGEGSHINANSATGGLSVTANTLTVAGIIYQ